MEKKGALWRGSFGACIVALGPLCGCGSVAPERDAAKAALGIDAPRGLEASAARPAGPILFGGWHEVQPEADTRACLLAVRDLDLSGAHEQALERLDRELRRSPGSCSLREARAALYAAQGFERAAEADFLAVTDLAPWRVGAWVGLGRTRLRLGLEYAAAAAFREARLRGYQGEGPRVASGPRSGP